MNINLLKHQYEFLTAEEKFLFLCGGIGSGKSFIGAHYIINRVIQYPKALHFIGANSFSQLRNSTLNALFGVLQDLGIDYAYNQTHGLIEFCNGKVLAKSMENFNMLRGIEIASFWLDEARDMKHQAYEVLIGRMRDKHCDRHQGRITSSPAGFNWLHDVFIANDSNQHKMINAKSTDNIHLPKGYIDSLDYDDKMYAQEVLGEFINITQGKVYYTFNREIIKSVKRQHGLPLYFGLDFNVDPMTAIVAQVSEDTIYVIDEYFIRGSNTSELAQEIRAKYGSGHTLIPDSTGRALKTASAGKSDHDILREYGFNIPSVRNPYRRDRYNCVNNLIEKRRLLVSPKCSKLIKDLEQLSYKEGADIPDTSDKMIGHISDALGYLCWWAFKTNRPDRDAFVHKKIF